MTQHGTADAKNRPPSPVSAPERGGRVTIARHGEPAAEPRPAAAGGKRVSPASIDWLEQHLADLPASEEDSVEQLDALREDRGPG